MLQHWRRRIDDWVAGRLPQTDFLVLTQRNIYVLPTKVGLFLAVTLVVLLVASINYQANLGFLLTFMLAGSAFISVLVAHGTLRGLQLRLHAPQPVFAGTPATLAAEISHAGSQNRYGIELAVQEPTSASSGSSVVGNALPQQANRLELSIPAQRRGTHPCPRLVVQTHYPLGVFRAWAIWRPQSRLVIYPAPEPNAPPLPRSHEHGSAGAASARAQSFELDGFRTYQRGDPLKTILWKKAATAMATGSGDWARRDQNELRETDLWLDHSLTGLIHPEAVLSRLCAWALEAERLGIAYGLRLPHKEVPIGAGPAHLQHCLRSLAES